MQLDTGDAPYRVEQSDFMAGKEKKSLVLMLQNYPKEKARDANTEWYKHSAGGKPWIPVYQNILCIQKRYESLHGQYSQGINLIFLLICISSLLQHNKGLFITF